MYRNWKLICGVPDACFMTALALVDLKTEFGRDVIRRFPEYFSLTPIPDSDPIPFSIIRAQAKLDAHRNKEELNDNLVTYSRYWRDYNVPIVEFALDEQTAISDQIAELPTEIAEQITQLGRRAEVGDIFAWAGARLVVMENNDEKRGSAMIMYFASAERVDVAH